MCGRTLASQKWSLLFWEEESELSALLLVLVRSAVAGPAPHLFASASPETGLATQASCSGTHLTSAEEMTCHGAGPSSARIHVAPRSRAESQKQLAKSWSASLASAPDRTFGHDRGGNIPAQRTRATPLFAAFRLCPSNACLRRFAGF